ncbi:ribosomal protein S18-alanine N-acetyltransferase [Persephonella sp.]
MDINIREFSDSDLDKVRDIIHQNFKNPWSDSMILSSNPFSYKTVAILDNTVVGFLSGEIIYDEAHILMIAVDKNFQGKGIGKKLLLNFIDECISSGINSVFLEVSESNKKALRFYSGFGFYVYGIREKYYTTGENAFLMKLKL